MDRSDRYHFWDREIQNMQFHKFLDECKVRVCECALCTDITQGTRAYAKGGLLHSVFPKSFLLCRVCWHAVCCASARYNFASDCTRRNTLRIPFKVFAARQHLSKVKYAETRKPYSSRMADIPLVGRNFLAVCTRTHQQTIEKSMELHIAVRPRRRNYRYYAFHVTFVRKRPGRSWICWKKEERKEKKSWRMLGSRRFQKKSDFSRKIARKFKRFRIRVESFRGNCRATTIEASDFYEFLLHQLLPVITRDPFLT